MEDNEVFPLVGEEGFARLTAAFYKQVPGDDVLGPMYPADDLEGAEQRLRDYLVYRFGGPRRYEQQRGHPRLRGRHMPYAIDGRARDRWVECMARALDEAQLDSRARHVLWDFFTNMATFMINQG